MLMYLLAIIAGFALLVWSADKFVEGAAATAKHLGMPTLLIGILIVGFGTSAPEMVVSAIAAHEGNPSLALGNAPRIQHCQYRAYIGCDGYDCPYSHSF